MAVAVADFVSIRLRSLAAAMLCLMAAQLILASCTPEPTFAPTHARVAIRR